VSSRNMPGYGASFYPGTGNAQHALVIRVGAGDALRDVDITLSPTRTAHITGRIVGADGQPTLGGAVTLAPAGYERAAAVTPVGASLAADGAFRFPNVPPGEYVIRAYRGRTNAATEGEFGALRVSVDGTDIGGLVVRQSMGTLVSGVVRSDSTDGQAAPLSAVELMAVPVEVEVAPPPPWAVATPDRGGAFEMRGLTGVRRLEAVRTPPGWGVGAIRVNGVDVTDEPIDFRTTRGTLRGIEVVLTDRLGVLTGRVVGRDAGSVRAQVIVFPTDPTRWYFRSRFVRRTETRDDGTYVVDALPAGTYHAVAVSELPPGGTDTWRDPDFLDTLSWRSERLTVRERDRVAVNLPLTVVP
jgi:hypothetical protein